MSEEVLTAAREYGELFAKLTGIQDQIHRHREDLARLEREEDDATRAAKKARDRLLNLSAGVPETVSGNAHSYRP